MDIFLFTLASSHLPPIASVSGSHSWYLYNNGRGHVDALSTRRPASLGRDVQRQIQAGRDQKYWEVGDRGRKEKAKGMCGGGM